MSQRHSIFRPVCLAVILGLGIQVVVAFVVGWIAITAAQVAQRDVSGYISQTLSFLTDGTAVIRTWKFGSGGYDDDMGYSTLDGKPVDQTDLTFVTLSRGPGNGYYFPGPPPRSVLPLRPAWAERVLGFSVGGQPPVFWYLVHDGKREASGYFVGFDSKSKRCIGYIGLHGACADLPSANDRIPLVSNLFYSSYIATAQNFSRGSIPVMGAPATDRSNMPYWRVYLLSQNRLLEVDLRDRSVRTVMEAEGMISIAMVRGLASGGDAQSGARSLVASQNIRQVAVRTTDAVIVVDPSSGERQVYPLPAAIGRRSMEFLQLSDATLLVNVESKKVEGKLPSDIYWIRPGGQVQRHSRVNLLQRSVAQPDDRVVAGLVGIAAPLPVAWSVGVMAMGPALHVAHGDAPDYASAVAESLAIQWPGLLASFLLAALAVWLCTVRQRRYAMPGTRTWIVVMLLFGLPAYLGYRFHRIWPARIACPACGKPAPRDRDACPECHVPYPDPEPTGVEVFV